MPFTRSVIESLIIPCHIVLTVYKEYKDSEKEIMRDEYFRVNHHFGLLQEVLSFLFLKVIKFK